MTPKDPGTSRREEVGVGHVTLTDGQGDTWRYGRGHDLLPKPRGRQVTEEVRWTTRKEVSYTESTGTRVGSRLEEDSWEL